MEAKQNSIVRFMQQQDTQFVIPVYQRNYDWLNEQCRQLFIDIVAAGSNDQIQSHFVGSIVYLQTSITASPTLLTVIDGQQRLTTLTLIWIALRNRAKENGNESLVNEIEKKFLVNEFMNDSAKVKLRPIKKDDEALKYILKNEDLQWENGYSRLLENYMYFYDNISVTNIDLIRKGLSKLLFIDVALEQGKDDPQRIFQSLNSTGLDLSQADLIRNYILMDLQPKLQEELYEQYWVRIELQTRESIKNESKLSDFMRDYLTFKFREIPNKDQVFVTFEKKISITNENSLRELLGELRTFTSYYNRFINPQCEPDADIREHLHLIAKIPITVAYPFLLEIYHDYESKRISKIELIQVLELVQAYTWRRFICNLPTNALNKVFATLYKDVDFIDYTSSLEGSLIRKTGKARFPTDEEVEREIITKDMYNIKPANRMYFLERLENYGHRIRTDVENSLEVTVEHVFPQKPTLKWERALGNDFDEMKSLVNTAANLTLSAFNPSLSNHMFSEKRDMPEKGYKASPLRLDKQLADFLEWNVENLVKRREWILYRFKTIWKYPYLTAIKIKSLNIEEFYDIQDIAPSSVTGKSLAEIQFEGVVLQNPSWRDLLRTVGEIMFEREPHVFFSLDNESKMWVKTDPNFFMKALKISENYYIESHLSARDIVNRIQIILQRCDTDDELLIRFAQP